MRQILYNLENIQLNYLGAYVNAGIENGNLHMVHTLTDRQVVVRGETLKLQKLLTLLTEGTSDEELLSCLTEMGLQDQYEIWIREGLIE